MGVRVGKSKSAESMSRDGELLALHPRGGSSSPYVPYAKLPNEASSSWQDYQFLNGLIERDPFTDIESMISRTQDATDKGDLKQLQHEVEMLATNVSSGNTVSMLEVILG